MQPGPGGGSSRPRPRYLHRAMRMQGTGSNVQAPDLIHRAAKWRSRRTQAPVLSCGSREEAQARQTRFFPKTEEGRRLRGAVSLTRPYSRTWVSLLSACLSDESSLSPALTWSLFMGSPRACHCRLSSDSAQTAFFPPASFTLPSHSAPAQRPFLVRTGDRSEHLEVFTKYTHPTFLPCPLPALLGTPLWQIKHA